MSTAGVSRGLVSALLLTVAMSSFAQDKKPPIVRMSAVFAAGMFFQISSDELVQGFPEGPVRDDMRMARSNFNRAYGDFAQIVSITNAGTVEDVNKQVDEMMKTGLLLEAGKQGSHPTIIPVDVGKLTDQEHSYLRDSLMLNVSRGDIKIALTVRDQKSGTKYVSANSMSNDGKRVSGIFLGSTRLAGGPTARMRYPNTVCQTEVITTHLWGSPAEIAVACVRAKCEGDRCSDCVVTRSNAVPGLFGSLKLIPDAGMPGRKLTTSCCEAYFKYAWVTGFKSIKVNVEKVGFEIQGQLGQSGNGSFTVTECCGAQPSN